MVVVVGLVVVVEVLVVALVVITGSVDVVGPASATPAMPIPPTAITAAARGNPERRRRSPQLPSL